MTTQIAPISDADATANARVAVRLTRGISATWWYTAGGILFLATILVLLWALVLAEVGEGVASVLIVGGGGLVWVAAMAPLLWDYRNRPDAAPLARWRRALVPLLVAATYGVVAGSLAGVWLLAVLPVVEMLILLNWAPGVRGRLVLAATVLLGALWFIDGRFSLPAAAESSWWLIGFYSTFLPVMSVLSLWWWDVLVTLDQARAAEARLGATQERLRVATDVHDLQGHHLQVIALQLELAERLLAQDPAAALDHLQIARRCVDDARQGTRDLATRFRSVPLSDELANAVDLLRAAGTAAEAVVAEDADLAPASVLGPVIRETTTNILKHGGGRWARLSLTREGASWRLEIANDPGAEVSPGEAGGSGLEGIGRRVGETGGTVDVRAEKQAFTVTVTVPAASEVVR
ncbi:histidine kinase [Microbacterium sp. Root61]|uniref:sensor histidine kinase n=1 Tax=Microbacterium sp. Root61 TaxID=1736570 RepID=UPI0006F8F1E5|nr:histidine kinase [Microbacterium sp. Root61]KRA24435.1 histidine kinase [Microbacterium sp. Root61]